MEEVQDILQELKKLGKETTLNIFRNHGCEAELFGVSVADMKTILKRYKKRQDLALALFETKNADAQYLAGLMAVPSEFTREELMHWVDLSTWNMVHEYALAWNIAESSFAESIAFELLESQDPIKRQIAWSTLASYTFLEKRPELDEKTYTDLITRVEQTLQKEENRVKYCMNNFLIALGACEERYTNLCEKAAAKIGKVEVYMGKTACKVPEVIPYLEKIKSMNRIGKKKRTVKC